MCRLINKTTLILYTLLMLTTHMQAQYNKKADREERLILGVRMGGGIITTEVENSLVGNESDFLVHEIQFKSADPIWTAGLYAHKKAGYLFYQGNLSLTTYGVNYNVKSYDNRKFPSEMSERFYYTDLHLMGGLMIEKVRIGVGPMIHILLHDESELEIIPEYSNRIKSHTFGFVIGAGYNVKNVFLDLKFENSFRTVGDHIYYGDIKSSFKGTPSNLIFSAAYCF